MTASSAAAIAALLAMIACSMAVGCFAQQQQLRGEDGGGGSSSSGGGGGGNDCYGRNIGNQVCCGETPDGMHVMTCPNGYTCAGNGMCRVSESERTTTAGQVIGGLLGVVFLLCLCIACSRGLRYYCMRRSELRRESNLPLLAAGGHRVASHDGPAPAIVVGPGVCNGVPVAPPPPLPPALQRPPRQARSSRLHRRDAAASSSIEEEEEPCPYGPPAGVRGYGTTTTMPENTAATTAATTDREGAPPAASKDDHCPADGPAPPHTSD